MVWAKEPERLASVARSTLMPVRSISAKHRRERPLQRLVDGGRRARRSSRGFSTSQSLQADIGLLAGIFGGARDRARGRSVDRGAAGAHDLLLGEAGIGEQRAGKLLGQMLGAAGVERIGHEAGIVDSR